MKIRCFYAAQSFHYRVYKGTLVGPIPSQMYPHHIPTPC